MFESSTVLSKSRRSRSAAVLLSFALVVAACGGADEDSAGLEPVDAAAPAAAAADQPKDPIALPMSRADIADYLGLTIETVSRTFTRLKTDKIISLPDHAQVKVDDMAALVSLPAGIGTRSS